MKTNNKTVGGKSKASSGGARKKGGALDIQSILVPTDFSAPAVKALHQAVALAKQFGAKIILLNVVEPIGATPDFAYNPMVLESEKVMAATNDHLKRLVKKEQLEEIVEKTVVRNGVPYSEISAAAKSLKCDLIVIATHGYTGLKHVFLGSTTERVVRHATCPVLVIRA
jgi:universal stress protein A